MYCDVRIKLLDITSLPQEGLVVFGETFGYFLGGGRIMIPVKGENVGDEANNGTRIDRLDGYFIEGEVLSILILEQFRVVLKESVKFLDIFVVRLLLLLTFTHYK